MKEAGFLSPQVKTNVEQAVQPPPQTVNNKGSKDPSGGDGAVLRNEDVDSVVESLVMTKRRGSGRRRSTVIVGECVGSMDRVARAAMEKVEKGELRHDAAAARNMRFIKIPMVPLVSRDGVERTIGEVRKSVVAMRRCSGTAEAVLYLGDLKWMTELPEQITTSSCTYNNNTHSYCRVRDMFSEIEKLIGGKIGGDDDDEEVEDESSTSGGGGRWRVMGIATFQTYMRCMSGNPSLETLLGLQPLIIPAGSLHLSLISSPSSSQSPSTSSRMDGEDKSSSTRFQVSGGGSTGDEEKRLTCCADCSANFESEARSLNIGETSCPCCDSSDSTTPTPSSTLPSWLQKHKHQNQTLISTSTINDQNCDRLRDLCKKWNSICSSVHSETERSLTCSPISSSPTSSDTSGFFSFDPSYRRSRRRAHQRQHQTPPTGPHPPALDLDPPTFRLYIPEPNNYTSSPVIISHTGASSAPTSASSCCGDVAVTENMVPWKRLSHIMSTVSECRSGTAWRKGRSEGRADTWLFFEGTDAESKERTAREVARLVFGTATTAGFVAIALSHFSTFTRADSTEDLIGGNKRCRYEKSCTYLERFEEAVSESPHRVFLLEDVEQADQFSRKGIKRAAERGMINGVNGVEIWLSDAVVILSCESFSSTSRACSPRDKQRSEDDDGDEVGETSNSLSLDLNIAICNNDDDHHHGGDDESVEDLESTDEIGLLDYVDARIVFNL